MDGTINKTITYGHTIKVEIFWLSNIITTSRHENYEIQARINYHDLKMVETKEANQDLVIMTPEG